MQEGLAYRITPFNTTRLNARIDSEKMYDNLMNKFKFGGINNPDIYIDETVMRMCPDPPPYVYTAGYPVDKRRQEKTRR